jgi:4-amino-4-deoxy-L-arabinose transferase-like glycosyltransferase
VTRKNLWKWIDRLWLLALAAYIFAGVPLATYHGDETAMIIDSRDFNVRHAEKLPAMLAIRFSWAVSAFDTTSADFRALREPWNASETYEQNAYAGRVADEPILYTARYGTAALLALSVVALFMLGRLYGGRPAAYLASALYGLHPLILLNGRRALEDSALLLLILLSLWGAAWIIKNRSGWRIASVLAVFALVGIFALVGARTGQNLPLIERAGALLSAPFQTPLQHGEDYAESPYWAAQQAAYDASPLRGLSFGGVVGLVLTGLILVGVFANLMPRYRRHGSHRLSMLLIGWIAVTSLLVVLFPTDDPRAAQPLIPLAALLVALGVVGLVQDTGLEKRYANPLEIAREFRQGTFAGLSLSRPRRYAAPIWLIGLSAFILAGVPSVTFHGDEVYYMLMARDYFTVFVEGRPDLLPVKAVWESDTAMHRVVIGSTTPYFIGASWALAGKQKHELAQNGWYLFGISYDDNQNMGLVPSPDRMLIARLPIALLFCGSAALMFGLARLIAGKHSRFAALFPYLVSGLYALNPVLLVNGRRALQESALLFFGLGVIAIAAFISRKRELAERVHPLWWLGLIVVGGLACASKQSGLLYAAAAFGWLAVAELTRVQRPRALVWFGAKLAAVGLLTLLAYYALSPGLWNADPLFRFQDMVATRERAMAVQITLTPGAPAPPLDRLRNIVMNPFILPAQHYEVSGFAESPAFMASLNAYMASPLSGLQFGAVLGTLLTVIAGAGLVINLSSRARGYPSNALAAGLYVWIAANVAALMFNPLPWQRYYLSVIPPMTIFCALGLWWLARVVTAPRAAPTLIQSPENA